MAQTKVGRARGSGVQLGYAISSEEHPPNDIVRHAQLAEQAGFPYALVAPSTRETRVLPGPPGGTESGASASGT